MKVFVIGATGYIGRVVTERLQAAGHQVVGLARSPEAANKLTAAGAAIHYGNLNDPATLAQGAKDTDATIWVAQNAEVDFANAEAATQAALSTVLDTLAGTDKTLIFTTGTGMYPDTGSGKSDESVYPAPPPMMAWMSDIEQTVLTAAERGVRGILIRPTIVYGRGGSAPIMMMMNMIREAGVGYYVGDGTSVLSTIHVDDLAEVYLRALEGAPAGTLINVAAEPPVRVKDIVQAISDTLGLTEPLQAITPEVAFEKLGWLGAELFGKNMYISNERVMSLLNWRPQQPSLLEELRDGSYQPLVQ
jgi:nucleoside-diphosphate-sugar epimerase